MVQTLVSLLGFQDTNQEWKLIYHLAYHCHRSPQSLFLHVTVTNLKLWNPLESDVLLHLALVVKKNNVMLIFDILYICRWMGKKQTYILSWLGFYVVEVIQVKRFQSLVDPLNCPQCPAHCQHYHPAQVLHSDSQGSSFVVAEALSPWVIW